jgi:hypothetical protein
VATPCFHRSVVSGATFPSSALGRIFRNLLLGEVGKLGGDLEMRFAAEYAGGQAIRGRRGPLGHELVVTSKRCLDYG